MGHVQLSQRIINNIEKACAFIPAQCTLMMSQVFVVLLGSGLFGQVMAQDSKQLLGNQGSR